MGFVQIAVGVLLVLFSIGGYSAQLEYYSVVNIKNNNELNLRAWPSNKSKILAHLTSKTKNITFLNKRKIVDKDAWMKVRWNKQEGWVNSYFLKNQMLETNERAIKPDIIQKKQHIPVASLLNKPVLKSRNKLSKNRLNQHMADKSVVDNIEPAYSHTKTKVGHSFAVQPQINSRLSCRGSKPTKWRIKMNMKNKRMWVKIEDEGSYSLPITYSQWNRTSRKRMIILAGKGRKRVKAVLNRNRLCRRKFVRARYTYSIDATISRSQFLSGCCADISR